MSDEIQGSVALVSAGELETAELHFALEKKASVIAVVGHKFAGQLARSIMTGNLLHKTAVLSGVASIFTALTPLKHTHASLPLCALSVSTTLTYTFIWRRDPLAQYQVDAFGETLASLPHTLVQRLAEQTQSRSSSDNRRPGAGDDTHTSFTVLVRRDDSARQVLHSSIAALALLVTGIRVYRAYNS